MQDKKEIANKKYKITNKHPYLFLMIISKAKNT